MALKMSKVVKNGGKLVLAVAVLGVFLSSVETVRSIENPYLTISKRNAFDLTSEPPPGPKTAPEPPKSEDIKLTGIYQHEGVERAALALIDTKKKADPPNYLQLAAGDKKDGIEIVSIDKATGKVTIKEFGELRSLNFKEDAFKTSVTKAPRKTSSRSSSSKSSSDAARKAAEIRAAIEKKRAEEAAKRSGGSEQSSRDKLRERFANMSDADRQKYAQQMRERYSSQSRGSERSDRGDRGGNSDSRRGR
ncbi:MAG: hypothetical protein QGI20_07055 [Verrucomicrobiota bacterium]|nr:hypothetical protein [Verrucomicrobiota bacterium]